MLEGQTGGVVEWALSLKSLSRPSTATFTRFSHSSRGFPMEDSAGDMASVTLSSFGTFGYCP